MISCTSLPGTQVSAELDLVAGSFVAAVGGIEVGRVLHAVAAGLGLDDDLVAAQLALLSEDCDQSLIGRAARVVGSIGQAGDEEVEVFSGLLTVACAGVGVLGVGEESRWSGRVTLAEVFGQGGVGVAVVALELGQEAFDGDRHELGATEGGHMAEDVGRVETLSGDVEVEGVDELAGDVVEDASGEVIVAEESLIAFEGARGESGGRLGVEGVLDVGAEDVGFDGVLSGPVEEVGEEDEAGHGIEFFGGSAEGVTEVFGEIARRA